ncbi:MAG: hypothetical protein GY847_39390 [Proteobacteria bacterium]|nr:hypothetical protein [Pseudomonadota bacterium]
MPSLANTCSIAKCCFLSVFVTLSVSCAISDNDRCGKGYYYTKDDEIWGCMELEDTATNDSDESEIDSGIQEDSGTIDSGEELPSGFEEICETDLDCVGYEADYCAIDITTGEGRCTIKDCSIDPDDCPGALICCDLPAVIPYPNICMSEEKYQELKAAEEEFGGPLCSG